MPLASVEQGAIPGPPVSVPRVALARGRACRTRAGASGRFAGPLGEG